MAQNKPYQKIKSAIKNQEWDKISKNYKLLQQTQKLEILDKILQINIDKQKHLFKFIKKLSAIAIKEQQRNQFIKKYSPNQFQNNFQYILKQINQYFKKIQSGQFDQFTKKTFKRLQQHQKVFRSLSENQNVEYISSYLTKELQRYIYNIKSKIQKVNTHSFQIKTIKQTYNRILLHPNQKYQNLTDYPQNYEVFHKNILEFYQKISISSFDQKNKKQTSQIQHSSINQYLDQESIIFKLINQLKKSQLLKAQQLSIKKINSINTAIQAISILVFKSNLLYKKYYSDLKSQIQNKSKLIIDKNTQFHNFIQLIARKKCEINQQQWQKVITQKLNKYESQIYQLKSKLKQNYNQQKRQSLKSNNQKLNRHSKKLSIQQNVVLVTAQNNQKNENIVQDSFKKKVFRQQSNKREELAQISKLKIKPLLTYFKLDQIKIFQTHEEKNLKEHHQVSIKIEPLPKLQLQKSIICDYIEETQSIKNQIKQLQRKLIQMQNQNTQLNIQNSSLRKNITQQINNYDKYFSASSIFEQSHQRQKKYIVNLLQKKYGSIKFTKLIYRYDVLNKVNFHQYIDFKQNLLLIVKTEKNQILGAYTQDPFQPNQSSSQGFIYTATQQIQFNVNLKSKKLVTTYDTYYIVFGNSEIRIKAQDKILYSNFGILNNYFETNGKDVDFLFKQGKGIRETLINTFQIYQIKYSQNQTSKVINIKIK